MSTSTSTTADIRTANRPGAIWARRAMLGAMAVLVVAALLTLMGVHSSQTTKDANGYRLQVVYPRFARPGLDAPWQVTVTHAGGFGGQVKLAVSGDYFNLFESQGFRPQPSSETRDGTTYFMTFTAPPGDVFRVYFDAYIQPASQSGSHGWVAVVDGGHTVVRSDYDTWLWP